MGNALVQSATIQLKAQAGGGFGSVPDGAPTDQITINGSGFGSAPNVVLFARLEGGTAGEVVSLNSPEIGAWSTVSEGDNGALPRYKELDGVTGFAMRDDTISPYTNNKYLAQCIIDNLPPNSEYRLSYRVGMPLRANNLGGYFPAGATQHSTIVDCIGSAWKLGWMCNSDYAGRGIEGNKGGPNLCIPTAVNNDLTVQGNFTSAKSNSPP